MSTIKTTFIQHPSADTPAIELDAVDGVVFSAASFDAASITSGTFADARIPNLPASKITSGTFADARIPNLPASKITSGTFTGNGSGLTTLNASNLSSGTVNSLRLPAGTIVDVKQVTRSAIASVSLPAGGSAAITGMSIAHSTKAASNKVLIIADLSVSWNQGRPIGIVLAINNVSQLFGDAAGSRTRVHVAGNATNERGGVVAAPVFLFSPATTASRTYSARWVDYASGGGGTVAYLNRSRNDSDFNDNYRSASTFTLMEIAG